MGQNYNELFMKTEELLYGWLCCFSMVTVLIFVSSFAVKLNQKQSRQCTCNIILIRNDAIIVAVEKQ